MIKLDHPNIVRIHSYGQDRGNLFFSMELVEGSSLFQLQKKGHRFDWREILQIAKSVCKGLRHAHDRGIIHRDLKPGNLLMPIDEDGNRGEVKITDFGIAKRFGASQITGSNVLGTMDFMSPEQAKGQPVTIRSDLYSLGTVMFTLLSGKPPFTANSVEESLRNLTKVPAPHVSSVVPEVPKALDRLIQKLMAKKPENRIQTAQALIFKIEEVEQSLLESSRAKTHEVPVDEQHSDTFEVSQPGTDSTKANTQPPARKAVTSDSRYQKQNGGLRESHPISLTPPVSSAREIDYFNTVTDQIRQVETAIPESPTKPRGGMLPILIALIAVIGLAGLGIYQAYRPPSAETLFTEIEASVEKPNAVLTEIDQFLNFYPDDPRIEQVKELQTIAQAIQHYNGLVNRLSVRSNMAGENKLTEVEKQFLSIIDLSDEQMESAKAKMAAFITVHKNDSSLDQRDQDCLKAARGYFIKLSNDARHPIAGESAKNPLGDVRRRSGIFAKTKGRALRIDPAAVRKIRMGFVDGRPGRARTDQPGETVVGRRKARGTRSRNQRKARRRR